MAVGFSCTTALAFMVIIFLASTPTIYSSIDCYTSIFSFGDSLADTGNSLFRKRDYYVGRFPYGETFFHSSTGRFSDGRLIVDFIAQELGLPYLPPYLGLLHNRKNKSDILQGVNFAVGGATALNFSFFEERGIRNYYTNNSLGIQLQWFEHLLPSICPISSDCADVLKNSLFLVGEIGGNDYNYPFLQKRSLEEIQSFVLPVITTIGYAVDRLIKHGARVLVVPGNLPIGCSTAYLTVYQSQIKEDYDPRTGCINYLNDFAMYHNRLLQEELHRLRHLHPHATIIYADYYNAAMRFYQSPLQFGFGNGALAACCGGGGPYNYNASATCGNYGWTVCDKPSSHVAWDGIHLTEAAYRSIADALIRDSFCRPSITATCEWSSKTREQQLYSE